MTRVNKAGRVAKPPTYAVRIHTVDAKMYTLASDEVEKLIEQAEAVGYLAFASPVSVEGSEGKSVAGRAVIPWHNVAAIIIVESKDVR